MSARKDAASRAEREFSGHVLAGSLLTFAVVVIAAAAAWPIYRSGHFLLLVAAAAVVAAILAVITHRFRLGGWVSAGLLIVALFVVGVPLAVPSRLSGVGEVLRGFADVATGTVFGWKDLVTVELPVGTYRNLLVPALVVFLLGTFVMLRLSWSKRRIAYLAVPVGLAMLLFGLVFGRAVVSAPLRIGPIPLYAPVETALGIAGLLVCLVWLAWRARDERVRALQRAAAASGVRWSRRPTRADRARGALGAGMVVVATIIALVVVPFAARGAQRDVLRTAIGPEVALAAEVSPLSQYRSLFTDERADDVLFTVSATGGLDRVRLATLDAYDGEVYRPDDTSDSGRFVRVPSQLDPGAGTEVVADVTVADLGGIWMPTAGSLTSVEFTGPRAAALADGFYYSVAGGAGVETAGGGLASEDGYTLRGVQNAVPALAEVDPPGGAGDDPAAPESLRSWVQGHQTGSDGAALADLVTLLRERGFLSHGLTEGETAPVWTQSLAGYVFQPSTSGHSLARIDAMFTRLLEREADPRAAASENYVAAVGDDEQFAVAVALIAREFGFPSRVVMGARLASDDETLPVCAEAGCRAQDISVWTEVRASDGAWIPVDVTPQYAQSPSLDVTEQRDPEVVTQVRPDVVREVVPPEPLQEDSASGTAPTDEVVTDLAWLWPILRITGIALLVLLIAFGPILAVIIAKTVRRRGRRHAPTATARIVGGWDELVDSAVDARREPARTLTREELAGVIDTSGAAQLATDADRAAFSGEAASDAEAADYWAQVDSQRKELARSQGVWRRFVAAVSLRSFFRSAAPAPGVRKRTAERGKRPAVSPVRSAS